MISHFPNSPLCHPRYFVFSHNKSVCDGTSSYDQSIYVQPNPISVPWTLYLTWSFFLRLLEKLQSCVWGIICVIMIWMKDSSLLKQQERKVRKKQHTCETALLRAQNDILKSIDNKQCVVLLLVDLSAAFDIVNHEILLHRLRSRFVANKFKSKLKTFLFKRVYELSSVFILHFCDYVRIICKWF